MKAFPYQVEAVNAIKNLPYAAVFHEQGLGKTKIAIDLLLYWVEQKLVDTVLIVTKKILINNWLEELHSHTFIKPLILTNDKLSNFYIFNSPSRVIITNFEVISTEKERFKLFLKTRNTAIIIDESAKLKNPNSNLTKIFFDLSPLFIKKVIMTGTPIANRPYDIWSQIYFLDHGESLGKDYNKFRDTTNLSNELFENTELQEKFETEIESIFGKIKSFSVRETKSSNIISLPRKCYFRVYSNWDNEQKQLYMRIKTQENAFIIKNDEALIDESKDILKRLLRLIQVASNPRLVDESFIGIPGKVITLRELLTDIKSRNEKCIIWTNFIENVEYLSREFNEYHPVKVHGKMNIQSRNKSIYKFKNDPETLLLFATPSSAKEGLTLTVANNVIFYDRSFSLDDYLQAQDRIHRISQQKDCNIYNIIMKESIDEWIDVLLSSKELAAKLSQGDISLDDYQEQADYSFGEIVKRILDNTNGV
jgi:SNF2 family DNA or RNA helicase